MDLISNSLFYSENVKEKKDVCTTMHNCSEDPTEKRVELLFPVWVWVPLWCGAVWLQCPTDVAEKSNELVQRKHTVNSVV